MPSPSLTSRVIFPVLGFLGAASAHAQTWTNPSSGDWFTASNWDSGTVPAGPIVSIKNGGTAVVGATGALAPHLQLGPGCLVIQNGGGLSSSYSYVNGALRVTGAASTLQGGTINVGYGNVSGSLTIREGGAVSSSMGYLDYVENGTVTATVEGAGSLWSAGGLMLSYGSVLTVRDKGVVEGGGNFSISGATVLVSGAGSRVDFGSGFAINGGTTSQVTLEAGGTLSAEGAARMDGSATAALLVTGAGSSWASGGGFTIYCGELKLRDGGEAHNAWASLERQNSFVGKASIDGGGSMWTLSEQLVVRGELTVSGGGSVRSATGYLFNVPVVSVTGLGSSWIASSSFEVQGNLTVSAGGLLQNGLGTIGSHYSGAATVTGAGSAWRNDGDLRVGCATTGDLQILGGAEVTNQNGYIGYYGSGMSTVRVAGAGSRWQNRGDLHVGYYSSLVPGVVTIADGGRVDADGGTPDAGAGTIYLGENTSTTGTLNIGQGGAGGVVKAGALVFGSATGRLVFNHSDSTSDFSPSISGPGGIAHQGTGKTVLRGDGAAFTGVTTVSAGTLLVGSVLGGTTSTVAVSSGATVGGSGRLGVVTLNSGAVLAVGDDGGDATFAAANLRWTGGASVQMDLGSAVNSDKIVLSGALTKVSGTTFSFRFKLGSDYAGPATYDIATFGSTNFTASNFSTSGPVAGTFQIVNGNTLRFTTVAQRPTIAVPAAASVMPVGAGAVSLSVLGADAGGEANLVYEWSGTGPAAVFFSPNGSNAAKSTTATFTKAGLYELTATVANATGASVKSAVMVSVGQRFAWWGAEQGLAVGDASPSADPDGDGVANLLEYALGMYPKVHDFARLPVARVEGGNLVLTYTWSAVDVVYQPEWSEDLTDWRTEGIVVNRSGNEETATVALAGNARRFLRLKVTQVP